MFSLAAVVELLAYPRADLHRDLARIDGRVHAAMKRKEHVELGEIGLHGRGHVGILQLAGEVRTVPAGGAMHLSEGSSC